MNNFILKKNCLICNKEFQCIKEKKKTCSKKCREEYYIISNPKKLRYKRCKRCGKDIIFNQEIYCNTCKKIRWNEMEEDARKRSRISSNANYQLKKLDPIWKKKKAESLKKTLFKKYQINKEYNLSVRLRNSLNQMLKKYIQFGKIYYSKKYGINYNNIIEYLKPFPENLSNYEIHHIKPLYTFNFINEDGSTNMDEIKKAFAPENHKLVTKEEHIQIHHPPKLPKLITI